MPLLRHLIISCLLFCLTACTPSFTERKMQADKIAEQNNFKKEIIDVGDMLITSYQKITNPESDQYIVYIEGDGLITRNGFLVDDPTPTQHLVLKLASFDKRANIIYLARPCQYADLQQITSCNDFYWGSGRLADIAIKMLNKAIIKATNNAKNIQLIGYSGGGGVAVLIGARNKHIKSIITIAGNLDIDLFCNHHQVPLMEDSLNPVNYTEQTAHIPQLHLVGIEDTRVPAKIAEKYVEHANNKSITLKMVPATHSQGWLKFWPNFISNLQF